jgi:predicted nucleic acid-binding protein
VTTPLAGEFLDSNVVLYLASADERKANLAEAILARGAGIVSVQVLNEVTNVARRKMGLSWQDTNAFLALIRGTVQVVPNTVEVHERGLLLAERDSLSVYDAMIVAAALSADCSILWSEDMQHGFQIEGLRITNPFGEA